MDQKLENNQCLFSQELILLVDYFSYGCIFLGFLGCGLFPGGFFRRALIKSKQYKLNIASLMFKFIISNVVISLMNYILQYQLIINMQSVYMVLNRVNFLKLPLLLDVMIAVQVQESLLQSGTSENAFWFQSQISLITLEKIYILTKLLPKY